MGFDIPKNFDFPYLSKSITEFWRRWHISLSSWLRDYLYFPLGGNRLGKMRTYINLMLVMLLGGLWHGASWNFVVWGGLHGLGLAVHRLFSSRKIKNNASKLISLLSWFITMVFVATAWVFFRSANFGVSWVIMQKLYFVDSQGVSWLATGFIVGLIILLLSDWASSQLRRDRKLNTATFPGLLVLIFVALGCFFMAPDNPAPFIYFQF